MPATRWTLHVKEFARKHNLSYGCAMSTPECRQSYHRPARVRGPARARPSRRARREKPSRRARKPHSRRRSRLSEEEEFYLRNPQLNIERMAGDYDYGEY